MRVRQLSRRALLRGVGGVAISLPFLDIMRPQSVLADPPVAPPKRFFAFLTKNGFVNDQPSDYWSPTGTETSFTLSPILQPLAPHQSKLIVLKGVSMASAYFDTADECGHARGHANQLTGIARLSPGALGGPSIDQYLASKIGQSTKFPSLLTATLPGYGDLFPSPFASGPGQAQQPAADPYEVFTQMFSDPAANASAMAAMQALEQQKKSVLDTVSADLTELQGRLGASDKMLLEAHLASIRAMEQQFTGAGQADAACTQPGAPAGSTRQDGTVYSGKGAYRDEDVPTVTKNHLDLIAMAFACDLTRVAALDMGADPVYSWVASNQGLAYHQLTHSLTTQAAIQNFININVWQAQQFKYLLDKLDAVTEGNGSTILDNSIAFWSTHIRSTFHTFHNIEYTIAGGAGGVFKTGRFIQLPNKYPDDYGFDAQNGPYVHSAGDGPNHNDLLVAFLNAMGLPDKTFGDPKYMTGIPLRLTG